LNKRLPELEALRKDHASATQEIAKLQHSLKIVTDLNAQAKKDLAERLALAVQLQKQVDDLKVSLQSCQSGASAAVKQCATKTQSLSKELKTLNVRYEKSVGDLAAAKAQLKSAGADDVSCASEVKIHKSSIASLETKLAQCETDKKSCNEARDAAVQRVQALNKESAEFRHMIKDCSQNHVIPIFTHTHTCRTRSSSPPSPHPPPSGCQGWRSA
jgi:chromosome segregation ATPase